MRLVLRVLGVIAVLLGSLWLLQGLGVVHIQPILCVAECEAVQGPAPTWAILGVLLILTGMFLFIRAGRQRVR